MSTPACSGVSTSSFFRFDEVVVASSYADRASALQINQRDDFFIHMAAQHHFYDVHRFAVGHAHALHEFAFFYRFFPTFH